MRLGYRIVYTTADVGLLVRAQNLPELFRQAALGVFDLLADRGSAQPKEKIAVELAAQDGPELMVRWLNEIIFQHEAKGLVFAEVEVDSLARWRITGRLWGEVYDPAVHTLGYELKGVTYHQLSLEKTPQGIWRLRVIIDI